MSLASSRPPVPCRPYSPAELTLVLGTVGSVPPVPLEHTPDALFISGLPGAGKSYISRMLETSDILPRKFADFVIVDADEIRNLHGQYAAFASSPVVYDDIVAWWSEGSGFEKAVFKDPGGLLDVILTSRRSFLQPAVMRAPGNVEWVRHVISHGFRAHLLLVHVPLSVAKTRAAHRTARLGRHTAPSYIDSCEAGLRQYSCDIALLCELSGGTVRIVDNTQDTAEERSRPSFDTSHALLAMYKMKSILLSPSRVRGFAIAQMNRLPQGALVGVDCSLAGGSFRCLLQFPDASPAAWAAAEPRDLDIWPVTHTDEKLLVKRLSASATNVQPGRWNTRFTFPGPLLVEIVNAYGRDLQETLAHFDIAIAAIGVRFVSGDPLEVSVHRLAIGSVESSTLLLLPGASDSVHMLSTVERLLRYERQLEWNTTDQMAQLLSAFRNCSSEARVALLENYKTSTQGGEEYVAVRGLLGLGE